MLSHQHHKLCHRNTTGMVQLWRQAAVLGAGEMIIALPLVKKEQTDGAMEDTRRVRVISGDREFMDFNHIELPAAKEDHQEDHRVDPRVDLPMMMARITIIMMNRPTERYQPITWTPGWRCWLVL